MNNKTLKTFTIEYSIRNNFKSHNELCRLAHDIVNSDSVRALVDLRNVNFIASNLFSVLGAIFYLYKTINPKKDSILIGNVSDMIINVIQKNGFCQHLGLERLPDVHNTVIPYKIFNVEDIEEYDRYLTINLFTRSDLPQMTQKVSDIIRDYLLELFKNIKDHTTSNMVFTCGQYFPQNRMLYFTIVDIGETIAYNVNGFHHKRNLPLPQSPLEWAIETGNTTQLTEIPRGLGLSLIKDFVHLNNGVLYIVSGSETYEITNSSDKLKTLDQPFPGTFVTMGFNLRDNAKYYLDTEENSIICF